MSDTPGVGKERASLDPSMKHGKRCVFDAGTGVFLWGTNYSESTYFKNHNIGSCAQFSYNKLNISILNHTATATPQLTDIILKS